MYKVIKKILRYFLYSFLILIIGLCGMVSYLYLSADMLTPLYEANTDARQTLSGYRKYGDNYLRKNSHGLWELKVQGNGFQRGEAIGKLSDDLLYYQEKVFVDQIREIIPSDSYLKFLRFFIVIFNRNLGQNVQEEFRNEIYGISLSCTDEYNFIGTPYERQLNYHSAHDLGHAMQDYMLVGCSSFATWGEQSSDTTLLIGRNFDFYMGDPFAVNKQVSFYYPEKGYKFAAIGWPGMTGVLSGMNEAGLSVSINAAKSDMPSASATPISILTREILQYASNIEEAYEIAKNRQTFVAESILIGSAKDGRAAVIEKSPGNIGLYMPDTTYLICTNHYQSSTFDEDEKNKENIATSDSPYRLERIQELLTEHKVLDERKAAAILRDNKGVKNEELGLANEMAINQYIAHHSVIFKPEKGIMWVSTSPWQCGEYIAYDLNKIFNQEVDFSTDIHLDSLTIAEDTFLQDTLYHQLLTYRELTSYIRQKTKEKAIVSEDTIALYEATNPHQFYMYEVLGDYYKGIGDKTNARFYWKEALNRRIPRLNERERINNKLKRN